MKIVVTFNEDIKHWLLENYQKYTTGVCAFHLSNLAGGKVTANQVTYWLMKLKLKKSLYKEPNDEQKRFIREKYADMEWTAQDIALELGVRYQDIKHFVKLEGLKKYNINPAPKKRVVFRVKGDHQNTTHSDRIDFWNGLSDEYIKNHKGRIDY